MSALVDWIPGGLTAALLLAFAFHRNRLGFIVLIALMLALSLSLREVRLIRGALVFGAPMLLLASTLREPALRSRRAAIYGLVFLLATSFTLYAPPHVFRGVTRFLALSWLEWNTTTLAAVLIGLGSAWCALRWIIKGSISEAVAALVLALVSLTCAHASNPVDAQRVLALAAIVAVLGVLWTSYSMAFIDGLTRLLNRRALDEHLARIETPFAIAMIDVDHFKAFNDSHGHDAGDVVLQTVSRTLRKAGSGKVFRFGGEEFCVVWPRNDVDWIGEQCELKRAAVAATPIAIASKTKVRKNSSENVTVSIGFATNDDPKISAKTILKAADQALYRAKKQGRNCCVEA